MPDWEHGRPVPPWLASLEALVSGSYSELIHQVYELMVDGIGRTVGEIVDDLDARGRIPINVSAAQLARVVERGLIQSRGFERTSSTVWVSRDAAVQQGLTRYVRTRYERILGDDLE